MDDWLLDLDGVLIEPFFQQYICSSDSDLLRGELLSRPFGHSHIEAFFDQLTYGQQVRVLEWQLGLKDRFTTATGCRVAVNVHNSLLATEDQRAAFLALVSRYPVPTTFEFTETYPMPPADVSNRLLRDLRELGHLSALDDFGTGLNGMSLLTNYDFDIVKIDRSLVFDIRSRVEKQKTVRLIAQMLDVLSKHHVVEGVDDDDLFALLKEAGFTTHQGFLFYEPEPLANVFDRLSMERAHP